MSQPEVDDQNSPMVVTVMTTEHFVLQTARSAGITETVGRAAIYLAAVSSGLIALAFVGQLSRLGAAFYVFGLVLLPTLAFVGVATFERAVRNGVEDVQMAGRRHLEPNRNYSAHADDYLKRDASAHLTAAIRALSLTTACCGL